MTKTRLIPLLLAAAAVIGASGCGGSGTAVTAPAADAKSETAATPTATPKPKPAKTAVTPTGSTLKLGSPAILPYDDPTTHAKSRVEVTPVSIVQGKKSDFANVQLDADQKTATPYYVKVHARNVGKGDLSKTDPADYLSGVDDRKQRQNAVIIFGTFDACDNVSPPKSLKPGEAYDTCQTYLIPKGGSLKGMVWVEYDQSRPGKSDVNWVK